MAQRTHRHKHRILKGSQKTLIILVIPISMLIAFILGTAIRGLPKLYDTIVNNYIREAIISKAAIKGSAVRRETLTRQRYEKQWRSDSTSTWSDTYDKMLQNKEPDKIKEIDKKLKDVDKGIY